MRQGIQVAGAAVALFLLTAQAGPAAWRSGPGGPGPSAPDTNARKDLFGVPLIDLPNFQGVGDFNGDGRGDLLGLATNAVVVRPGLGGGLYGPDVVTPVATRPLLLAETADFTGDGILDVAVCDSASNEADSSLNLMRGRGDGGFDLIQTIPLVRATWTMTAAELTGDGRKDLVLGLACGGPGCGTLLPRLVFLRNLGDGTMTGLASFDCAFSGRSSAAGDVDADGDIDVVAYCGGPRLYRNVGGGAFAHYPLPAATIFEMADLEGDGMDEILTLTSTVNVIRANNPPSFPTTNYAIPRTSEGLTTADLNGDGKLDVVLANSGILYGNGLGALFPPVDITSFIRAPRPRAFDYDDDGHLDLLTRHTSGWTTLILNRGDNTFPQVGPLSTTRVPETQTSARYSLVAGQFIGDGRPDVAAIHATEVVMLRGEAGDRLVPLPATSPFPDPLQYEESSVYSGMAAGDLDGDGDIDLALPTASGLQIGLGDPQGHFAFHDEAALEGLTITPVLADFNEDGRLDAIVCDAYTGTLLFAGRGDGTFEPPVTLAAIGGPLAALRLDSDSHFDFVMGVGGPTKSVAFFRGLGDGTFLPPSFSPVGPSSAFAIRSGDFNADDHLDLAVLNAQHGRTADVLLGAGDGSFFQRVTLPLDADSRGLAVADFDLDGFDDLFVFHDRHGERAIHAEVFFSGGPGGTFAGPFRFALTDPGHLSFPPSAPKEGLVVPPDLDEDGRPDLAVGTQEGIAVVMNRGTMVPGPAPVAVIAGATVVECQPPGVPAISLDGSGSGMPGEPPGVGIVSYVWSVEASGVWQPVGTGPTLSIARPLGASTFQLEVTNSAGQSGTALHTVTVQDTTPPALVVSAAPNVLFPPNHRLVPVQVPWQVSDACDPAPAVALLEASSDEADDAPGGGDGSTAGDIRGAAIGTADGIVELRAERSAQGDGREYRLRYVATDASGNATPSETVVSVPLSANGQVDPLTIDLMPAPLVIAWTDVGGPYDLIRGTIGNQSLVDSALCLGPVDSFTNLVEPELIEPSPGSIPPVGAAYFYLVQYHDANGASGYGTEGAPWPRVPGTCPPGP